MAFFDLPLEELRGYSPDVADPADFDNFWTSTIAEARSHDLALRCEPVHNGLSVIDSYDVTFAGFGGTPVKAWLHVPAGTTSALPGVVCYLGYSGGRGLPLVDTVFAQAGYAQLVVDTRGQGWSTPTQHDQTVDADPAAGLPGVPGQMTRGILDPHDYYYRRLFTDALRALDAMAQLPQVDASRLAVVGGSQGGGLAIAAAGLAALNGVELVGCLPDVPFLCHFERAVELTDAYPYKEISAYLAMFPERTTAALATLSYVDGVNFAKRATCPALFSVGLMDMVCPPSTVFAAFNAYNAASGEPGEVVEVTFSGAASAGGTASKRINVYRHNGHEGGREYQQLARLDWLTQAFD